MTQETYNNKILSTYWIEYAGFHLTKTLCFVLDDVREWFCHNKSASAMVVILILLFIAAIILFVIIKYKGSDNSDLGHFKGASIHSAEFESELSSCL